MSNEINRLRWRSRRGTRELDQVLGGWLDDRYANASVDMQRAFSDLLDQQDPDIWDWVMGNAVPSDPNQARVIDEIRTRHRL